MKTFYIIVFIFFSTILIGQSLSEEKLSVRKDFSGILADVEPLNSLFSFDQFNDNTQAVVVGDSLLNDVDQTIHIDLNIEPLSFETPFLNDGSNGHMMVSRGLLNTLGVQGKLLKKVDNYFDVGIEGNYSNWVDRSVSDKFTNEIKALISTRYFVTDRSLFDLKIGGSKDQYGVFSNLRPNDHSSDTINIKRFNVGTSYQSFNDDPRAVNYSLSINYNNTISQDATKENQWRLQPMINKKLNDLIMVQLTSDNTFSSNQRMNNTFASSNDLMFQLNQNTFTLSIGGKLNIYDQNKTIYPSFRSNIYLSNHSILSATVSENLSYIGLTQLLASNPYLDHEYIQSSVKRSRDHRLALVSKIDKSFEVTGQLSYSNVIGDINWTQSPDAPQYFVNVSANYTLWQSLIKVNYTHSSWLRGSLQLTKNIYNAESDITLFYRPDHQIDLGVNMITNNQKFSFSINADVADRQSMAVINEQVISSDYKYDLSFGVNYRPYDFVSLRITGSNMLNNSLEIFRGYEVFSRNVSLHALFKF